MGVRSGQRGVLLGIFSAMAHTATEAVFDAPTPSTNAAAAKDERVKRPTVTSAGSSEEWDYFLVRWRDYVEATKVTGKDRTIQLLECCDDQLRKDVTRSIGMGRTLTDRPEEEILTLVRRLAVREKNTMVYPRQFAGVKTVTNKRTPGLS